MDINDLISFGMTRTEARIYIEISKLGETKIGPIIRRTGLHRGTVYNSIHKLIDKGFLSFIDKDRFRFYKISDKRIFKNIIKGKQKEIEEKAIGIENFFEDLKKLGGREDLQDVQVFYGVNSFKSLFLEILDVCKEENCSYCVQGRGGQVRAVIGPAFYKHVQDLKKKMKIKCRAIMSPETKNWNYSKVLSAEKKYLKTEVDSQISVFIYEKNVLIVLHDSKPLISIKIRSEKVSEGFRNYFEHLWKIAKK